VRLTAIGESAQRKAAWRLLPVIAVGYGLAYMDRINISFAALQMNKELHFSAAVYGFWRGVVLYRLCAVRGAFESAAAAVWGEAVAGADHVDVGTAGGGDDVCAHAAPIQCVAFSAWHGGGRVLSRSSLLPDAVVSSEDAGAGGEPVLCLVAAEHRGDGGAGWVAAWTRRQTWPLGWQWLFLVEGLPTAAFSLVILKMLPDNPSKAAWLTADEKAWLDGQLKADSASAHLGHSAGVTQALLSPKVWMIGAFFFFDIGAWYAFSFLRQRYCRARLVGASAMWAS